MFNFLLYPLILLLHLGPSGGSVPTPASPHPFLVTDGGAIYTVRDGTKMTVRAGDYPSWTPDGRIIFVADQQVWVMDENGNAARQIGQLTIRPIMPQMARNGLIAFMVDSSIWTMQSDGSGLRKLVAGGSCYTVAGPQMPNPALATVNRAVPG